MTWNKKTVQIIIHIAVWTGFLLLPFVSFSGPKETPFSPDRKIQFLIFITNLFLIGFYYLHSLLLIPRLLAEKKISIYIVSIVSVLIVLLFIPYVYFQFVEVPRPRFPVNIGRPQGMPFRPFSWRRILPFTFPGTIMLFLLILIISGGIKIINQWFRSERRNEEIEREKAITELALLKSQINPHFLFNTLNNIYSLAVTNSPDTATSVMKLSSIMRYVLDDAKSNYVPLNREIHFLENFIALQRVRLTDKATINFFVEGITEDKQIAPLLLIAYVENAFKYGVSTHQTSAIDINLKVTVNQLHFTVTNQKMQKDKTDLNNTGIGLRNTKRRLELIYQDKHSLQVEDKETSFRITLILDLTL